MSHTERLKRSAKIFRQRTPAAFDQLLTELAPRYAEADAKRKTRPQRQRRPGPAASTPCPLATGC
jgi:hypothetical protein